MRIMFNPEHNVRYVSIMESVDTYADTVSNEVAPLINWSNEHFARQTHELLTYIYLILNTFALFFFRFTSFGKLC